MSRLATDYDRIVTSAPLNRTAAVVRDAEGEHYAPAGPENFVGGRQQWIAPPSCERLPHGKEDLSGTTWGRLKVIRFHSHRKGESRWLVRCSCGNYETRRGKAIRARLGTYEEACGPCAVGLAHQRTFRRVTTGRHDDGTVADRTPGLKTANGVRRLKDEAAS